MIEQYTFFWDGPFSQWHPSNFVIDGIMYNCAEQYMMASKAQTFGDKASHEAIMRSSSPREQKALGRSVKNFQADLWDTKAEEVVFRGSYAKFSQNRDLGRTLDATGDTILVEASPYDTIWGIGLAESDSRCLTKETWRGVNKLGYILTNVRQCLRHGIVDDRDIQLWKGYENY